LHVLVTILIDKPTKKGFNLRFFYIFQNLQSFWAPSLMINIVDLSKVTWIDKLSTLCNNMGNIRLTFIEPLNLFPFCLTLNLLPLLGLLKPQPCDCSLNLLLLAWDILARTIIIQCKLALHLSTQMVHKRLGTSCPN
jgi:hypothetical protein